MPFDLYHLTPATPDHRCGHDLTVSYAECCYEVRGTSAGVICLRCRREVADFEWKEMGEPQMRVKGGVA